MATTRPYHRRHPWREICLWISLLLWIWKGMTYFFLGRVWILIVVLSLVGMLTYNQQPRNAIYSSLLRLWGIFLMLWGTIRLILALLMFFSPISDLHVRQHFGWLGNLYSLGSCVIGYIVFKMGNTDPKSTSKP